MIRERANIVTTLNILYLDMKGETPSPVFLEAIIAEMERLTDLPLPLPKSHVLFCALNRLFTLEEDAIPSVAFTYAALEEMTRLVEILSADESEPPEGVIRAYLFMGQEYSNLRHFGFARKNYLKALETFPRCCKSILDDEEMAEIFEEGCISLLKIYGNMKSYQTADKIYSLIRDALPERADAIHKEAMKKPYILHDPMEYTDAYLAILPQLETKIEIELADVKRGHGFCFRYWQTKQEILKRDYGIKWDSPSILNPGVMFD